jgi:O-acetyl-ADP-ribose deacetylase (regulator of RNase III)
MVRRWYNKSINQLLQDEDEADPIKIVRRKTRELILYGYNLGWSGPPFDPIKLAQILKIELQPNELIPDARLIPTKGKKYTIEYNPFQRNTRINFSIAHEIGHTLFPDSHKKIRNRLKSIDKSGWELEFLCDIAASEILLPYAEFSREANKTKLDLNSLIELGNKYNASLEAVFLRFCEVVDKPCSTIVATFQSENFDRLKINYKKSSSSANLKIKSGDIIPNVSRAYECIKSGWTAHQDEIWPHFDNKTNTVYSIGLPPTKFSRNPRVGLLIVPEEYSEKKIGELYEVKGDATEPRGNNVKIIAQVVNSTGGLGFGFGRAMSKRWPMSKSAITDWKKDKNDFVMGGTNLTQLSEDTYVFQMIAQKGLYPNKGVIPLKYEHLRNGLKKLCNNAQELNASVHMPRIGAGQAQGNWDIISGIIYDELLKKGVDTIVYDLPGQKFKTKDEQTLSIF